MFCGLCRGVIWVEPHSGAGKDARRPRVKAKWPLALPFQRRAHQGHAGRCVGRSATSFCCIPPLLLSGRSLVPLTRGHSPCKYDILCTVPQGSAKQGPSSSSLSSMLAWPIRNARGGPSPDLSPSRAWRSLSHRCAWTACESETPGLGNRSVDNNNVS